MAPQTPLLDTVTWPADLRKLDPSQLRQFADELRAETISAVSQTGGHLGAGLGVVELTTALHYVFETPRDILIWDVGHQAYPHKIITGRRDRIRTLRQGQGLSGFTKRTESAYDPFGAAHAATSISAALGFAVARGAETQRRRDRGRGVRGAERVVRALRPLGEAGQAAALAQGADAVAPAGQDRVRIGRVADVPDEDVAGRLEDMMQGDGQLDHAQPRSQVAAGLRDRVDGLRRSSSAS